MGAPACYSLDRHANEQARLVYFDRDANGQPCLVCLNRGANERVCLVCLDRDTNGQPFFLLLWLRQYRE